MQVTLIKLSKFISSPKIQNANLMSISYVHSIHYNTEDDDNDDNDDNNNNNNNNNNKAILDTAHILRKVLT
jgi:hypothetical protein